MVETTTKNYGWTKPEIQHSPSTWGGFLNTDLDSIDALVFANQQGLSPVGAGALWFTPTPPANWLIADGRSLDTTTYATLFAVYGYRFGGSGANFNLPPLSLRFPFGAGTGTALAATGGEATHILTAAELAVHAHPITDVAHSHTAQQTAHAHVIATGSHSHAITTGSHFHSGVVTGLGGAGPIAGGAGATLAMGNTSTAGNLGGNTDTAGNLGGNTDTQAPAVSTNASGTGLSTTQNAGSGAAHNNLPPYLAIYFIVRYQ